jgi:hypothetical protein
VKFLLYVGMLHRTASKQRPATEIQVRLRRCRERERLLRGCVRTLREMATFTWCSVWTPTNPAR